MATEAETGVVGPQSRNVESHQKLLEATTRASRRSMVQIPDFSPIILLLDFRPPNCEKINF